MCIQTNRTFLFFTTYRIQFSIFSKFTLFIAPKEKKHSPEMKKMREKLEIDYDDYGCCDWLQEMCSESEVRRNLSNCCQVKEKMNPFYSSSPGELCNRCMLQPVKMYVFIVYTCHMSLLFLSWDDGTHLSQKNEYKTLSYECTQYEHSVDVQLYLSTQYAVRTKHIKI